MANSAQFGTITGPETIRLGSRFPYGIPSACNVALTVEGKHDLRALHLGHFTYLVDHVRDVVVALGADAQKCVDFSRGPGGLSDLWELDDLRDKILGVGPGLKRELDVGLSGWTDLVVGDDGRVLEDVLLLSRRTRRLTDDGLRLISLAMDAAVLRASSARHARMSRSVVSRLLSGSCTKRAYSARKRRVSWLVRSN